VQHLTDFEPRDVPRKLEFDKVLDLLVKEALTPMAATALQALQPGVSCKEIELQLREIAEFKLTLEKNDRFPLAAFEDIQPDLKMLAIDGYTLQAGSFQNVLRILLLTKDIFRYLHAGQKKEIYPKLFDIIRPLSLDEGLIKAINAVFDDQGEIRPDASPELLRIRKEITQKMRELDSRFRQIVQEYRAKGWLADTTESFRNGRRVLAVPAEHKRKIRGIIHDESDTGRTAFIEPEPIIEINNDIFDLENEEKREIFRILRDLSDQIRPYGPTLAQYLQTLIRFDVIQAKARLAVAMRANMPMVKEKPVINLRKAYHPLLLLKNKTQGKKTIPFDLKLNEEKHILILSGPNAGGKSVLMKSVGLLQLMVQSGLLVPVHELSEFGIFHRIFADIGDQQSLDDDLSTYSSRLKNAKVFIEKADHRSLVLIDEMGSGTDPKPGGAVAEATLRSLYNKGVFGVVTTHYSNLKVFAFRNNGMLNANMHFDKDTLSPTYELKVGRPGSSYAFEIAAKSGLPKHLIDYARNRTGSETAVDDILIELQREKQELEEHLRTVKDKQQDLERLIKTYDSLHHELEVKRKRLKLDQKEFELRQSANASREVDKLIRELKDEKNIERARQISDQLKAERQQKAQQVDEISEEVVQLEGQHGPAAVPKPVSPGDYVRLRAGGAIGKVEEVQAKKAIVLMGGLRLTVALRELLPAVAPTTQYNHAPKTDLQYAAAFESKLDLRGMSKEEALRVLEKFVDSALLSNAALLNILHGKGDGILRKVVRQKLREYGGNISNVYHPARELGGEGVTIVELS
jgi:DNA mismatch repair protein MutS2